MLEPVAAFGPDHELVDTGEGWKLERYGRNLIARPDAACLWRRGADPARWARAAARFTGETGRGAPWEFAPDFREAWTVRHELPDGPPLAFELKATVSKNVGLFPEQAAQWAWMGEALARAGGQPAVLNLFAYTGGATVACAARGAAVTHIDAAKSAVNWARRNLELSSLADRPVRLIVEDCATFVAREARRGRRYEALLLDPPAFGRDPKGRTFRFLDAMPELLAACRAVLVAKPLFVVLNGYATGLSAVVLRNLLADAFPDAAVEHGELHLRESVRGRLLPTSSFARFRNI